VGAALGDERPHVGARQSTEDALATVEDGAHHARVGGVVDVAPQGAHPGAEGTAEEDTGHDPPHGLVQPSPPAALDQEDGARGQQSESDEEGVGRQSDCTDVEEDGPHASQTLRNRCLRTADTCAHRCHQFVV
jgi:hypothetical protein